MQRDILENSPPYQVVAEYQPMGDQPQAIESIVEGIQNGLKHQVLLGVTGSGKTFTMANIIAKVGRPALILAHNKILAAQLCNEFREFFPHNRVEFFVSYYDYFQPEAYIARTDTYIEKDMAVNDEIDKLRNSATCSLVERRDTIVVASVSCIYGLGAPETYYRMTISLRPGNKMERDDLVRRLIDIGYKRNDIEVARTHFRVKGDTVEIFVAHSSEYGIRVEFFGDEIESVSEFDIVTSNKRASLKHCGIFPASHYVAETNTIRQAIAQIEEDKDIQERFFKDNDKLIEAQRIRERVNYDVEMLREMGFCHGIENYSRYLDGRQAGEPPYTLLDYFPDDFVLFVDESHITLPQVRGMYSGDKSRKMSLIEYGFRLPAAADNRPLNFEEFNNRIRQTVYVSATPAQYELQLADNIATQIIRPTGLLDPMVEVRPLSGQIEDLENEIKLTRDKGFRTLVTTLTKKMAESLTDYLANHSIKVRYLHSDIDTLERVQIIQALRKGEFDVIVGINLLREGLDIPEVALVAILDADKEGFLRSESSLIQTIGRAARNSEGRVLMYADKMTGSMERAIKITNDRHALQDTYNRQHNITPQTIFKKVNNTLEITLDTKPQLDIQDISHTIDNLKAMMDIASKSLDFETAIKLRDQISELKKLDRQVNPSKKPKK